MIYFDGDSVATIQSSFPLDESWQHRLAVSRNTSYEVLAKNESTAQICYDRAWRVADNSWYILCVGQWSQNHEPLEHFERFLRMTIEGLRMKNCRILLMTPPIGVWAIHRYIEVMHRMASIYLTDIFDLYSYLGGDKRFFIDERAVNCHLNSAGCARVQEYFDLNAELCKP